MRHAKHFLRSFQSAPSGRLTRGIAPASLVLFASVAGAVGAKAPAPAAPQTRPADSGQAQADPAPTNLAPVLVAPADPPPAQPAQPAKIVVLPFEIVGGKAADSWVARSIQQSIMTDLMSASRAQVISASVTPDGTAAAADLGHKLTARYVLFGQVHVNDTALRVTGEIVATDTDSVVGTLKATSPMNDLFGLEDALGDQARRAMRQLEFPNAAPNAPGQLQPMIQATGPVQVVPDNTVSPYTGGPVESPSYPVAPSYPDDYYLPYDYGYYPGYPLFYGGIGISGRGFRGGHGFGGRGAGGLRGGGGGGVGGHAGGGHAGGHR